MDENKGKAKRERDLDRDKFTPKKVAIYLQKRAGVPYSEIAEKTGIANATVYNWCRGVDEYMRETPEYYDALRALQEMIPESMRVYRHHLRRNSLPSARDVTKMTGLMVEHQHTTGQVHITEQLRIVTEQIADNRKIGLERFGIKVIDTMTDNSNDEDDTGAIAL